MTAFPSPRLAFLRLVWMLALFLTGCASAPGPAFQSLGPTDPRFGDVYLYREDSIFAGTAAMSVLIDDQPAGRLFNASYLWLRLAPGQHTIKADPGPLATNAERTITVRPGERTFPMYWFPTGLLYNAYFIGSSIDPKSPTEGLAALRELRSAHEGAASSGSIVVGNKVDVGNADIVPLINDRGRAGYREFLTKKPPRAFVIADKGAWVSTWGTKPADPTEPSNPAERALKRCRDRGHVNCRLYAVDNRVVWSFEK